MPDEVAPETPDTPTEEQAAPDVDTRTESTDSTAQPDTNWEKRYTDLQPEYTRASQEAAQYRQIIELARSGDREAIEWLGLDLADEDEPEDEETPEFHDPRVDQLLAAEQERQQAAELDSLESYVDGEISKLAKEADLDLSDDEIDLIFGALTPGENGNPDVARAFKKVTGVRDHIIKDYVAGKRRAPSAPSGSSPSHQPDLDDDKERRSWLYEQAQQLSS